MKNLLILLTILIALCSAIHKDLNEFGRWKKFHGIFEEEFRQVGSTIEFDIVNYQYDLSDSYQKKFDDFFIYSKDSLNFIDLDTYSLVLESDQSGNLYSSGSGVDIKVQVVNKKTKNAMTVLFCGTECYPETALWRNSHWLEIYGFELNEQNKFIPTMWKLMTKDMLFSKYQIDKTFEKIPKSYVENERLKVIEFKK